MKCPHCKYVDGWNTNKEVEGTKGPFYTLPVKMDRGNGVNREETKLYACPDCSRTFVCKW